MIGTRLKQIRKEKGLTQQAFATKIATSASYVSEIEKGKKIPGGDLLSALKQEYGIDINWLLTGEENAVPEPQKKKTKVMELIEVMLEGMSEDALRDVLKYTEEKKLLTELLAGQKPRRTVNGED